MQNLASLSDDAFSKLVITDEDNYGRVMDFIADNVPRINDDISTVLGPLMAKFPDASVEIGVSPRVLVEQFPATADSGIINPDSNDFTFLNEVPTKPVIIMIDASTSPQNIRSLHSALAIIPDSSVTEHIEVVLTREYTGELAGSDFYRRLRR